MKMMSFLLISFLLTSAVGAKTNWESPQIESDIDVHELELDEANEKVKVRDIKNLLKDLDQDSTCLDEYLKRRKQLLVKFAFTPITLSAAAAAGLAGGGMSGVAIAELVGVKDGGWTALGYFIGGAMIGTATTVIVVTADTAMTGLNYYDNDLMMKALGEYYLGKDQLKLQELYRKATKKMASRLSFEEFVDELALMDQHGELCDGSLVKQPRIRLGTKLKYKLARPKDLKKVF